MNMKFLGLGNLVCKKMEKIGDGHFIAEFDASGWEPPSLKINFRLSSNDLPDLLRVGGSYSILLSDTDPEAIKEAVTKSPP